MSISRITSVVLISGFFIAPLCAQPGGGKEAFAVGGERVIPATVPLAKAVVRRHLLGIDGIRGASVWWVEEKVVVKKTKKNNYEIDVVQATFPNHVFFVVRYTRYPIELEPPRGMRASNLIAVGIGKKETTVEVITYGKELESFFKKNFRSFSRQVTVNEAKYAMRAWLKLSQELNQDGYYHFQSSIVNYELRGGVPQVPAIIGVSVVNVGGRGKIQATIDFNELARIERVVEQFRLSPGIRPRR